MCVCLCGVMGLCVHQWVCSKRPETSDSQKLKLLTVVSCLTWVMGAKPGSSCKNSMWSLPHNQFLAPIFCYFIKKIFLAHFSTELSVFFQLKKKQISPLSWYVCKAKVQQAWMLRTKLIAIEKVSKPVLPYIKVIIGNYI